MRYLILLFTFYSISGYSADIIWKGSVDSQNWSEGKNWTGGITPGPEDVAVFDATCVSNCTMDDHILVGGIRLESGFTFSVTQQFGKNFFIGVDGFVMNGGTFVIAGGIGKNWGDFEINGGQFEADGDPGVTLTFPSATYESFSDLTCSVNNRLSGLENLNFIRIESMTQKFQFEDQLDYSNIFNRIVTTTYFDDMGRPIEVVDKQGSPDQKDIVQLLEYDIYGRKKKQYLPYISADCNGYFKDYSSENAFGDQLVYYTANPDQTIAKTETNYNCTGCYSADATTYAESVFESSFSGRLLEQAAPGKTWKYNKDDADRRTGKFGVRPYKTDDNILKFTFNYGDSRELDNATTSTTESYAAGDLKVDILIDEHGKKSQIFSNKQNRIIAKEIESATGTYIVTYYIYDLLGNVRFIISPEGAEKLSTNSANTISYSTSANDFTDKWVYTFIYDKRKRLIEKKVPGAKPVIFIYDELDRLILTQDGNQRVKKAADGTTSAPEYSYVKYDILQRQVYNGNIVITTDLATLRTQVAAERVFNESYSSLTSDEIGYTLNNSYGAAFTIAKDDVSAIQYFDTYEYGGLTFTIPSGTSSRTIGWTTIAKTRKRTSSTESVWLSSVAFYNNLGKVTKAVANNHLTSTLSDEVNNTYDFTGRLLQSVAVHTPTVIEAITVTEKYEYDHKGRLNKIWHNLNNAPDDVLLAEYMYNQLGQLQRKKLYAEKASSYTSFLQGVDFRYNIRGWLTHINANDYYTTQVTPGQADKLLFQTPVIGQPATDKDLFAMQFYYDQILTSSTVSQYGGNMSAMEWSYMSTGQSREHRRMEFTYDDLYRLSNSEYSSFTLTPGAGKVATYTQNTGGGGNESASYSTNGNITNLSRTNSTENIDALTYDYGTGTSNAGNKLLKIVENSSLIQGFASTSTAQELPIQYTYDDNGNMLTDANKGLTIVYNRFDRPVTITKSDGKVVTYVYDEAGSLISRTGIDGKITYYLGELEIVYDPAEAPEKMYEHMIHTVEGRVTKETTGYKYEYFYSDLNGNIRMVFGKDETNSTATSLTAIVIQKKDYYPFGMVMEQTSNTSSVANLYGFNGNELIDGVGLIDFNARMYDPAIARFSMIDPLADMYDMISTYAFAGNNPIRFSDPGGMDFWDDARDFLKHTSPDAAFFMWLGKEMTTDGTWAHRHRHEIIEVASITITVAVTIVTWGIGTPAAIAIGAGISIATAAVFGGLDMAIDHRGAGDIAKGAIIGAGVAAICVIVGGEVGEAVGGLFSAGANPLLKGIAVGAASGAAGGFVGGFAGGAVRAWWLEGANFGEGLGAGLNDAAMGALAGAVMGGIMGGITNIKAFKAWKLAKKAAFLEKMLPTYISSGNLNTATATGPRNSNESLSLGVSEPSWVEEFNFKLQNNKYSKVFEKMMDDPKMDILKGELNGKLLEQGVRLLRIAKILSSKAGKGVNVMLKIGSSAFWELDYIIIPEYLPGQDPMLVPRDI